MDKSIVTKIQANLLRISNGERFFFNIKQYENLGLIKARKNYCNDCHGNKVVKDHSYFLTDKGKRILSIQL